MNLVFEMNTNYENRKHGGESNIGGLQLSFMQAYPSVDLCNYFDSEAYFPLGERFISGSFEGLKNALSNGKEFEETKGKSL